MNNDSATANGVYDNNNDDNNVDDSDGHYRVDLIRLGWHRLDPNLLQDLHRTIMDGLHSLLG